MTTTIDLIEIADLIATTNPKVKGLAVGTRTTISSSKLSRKYSELEKLVVDTPIISIGRSENGIYGGTLQIWDLDGIPTIFDVNGVAVDAGRVKILTVLVGRSSGIASIILDGLELKISANLTDECILRNYPKDGKFTVLKLDELKDCLKEKPDSFVKLSDDKVPLNTNIEIIKVSGYTKKFVSSVYAVKYNIEGVTTHIERLLPNAKLRTMIEDGTKNFFISQKKKKTNPDGEIVVKVKLFDSDKHGVNNNDDIEFDT